MPHWAITPDADAVGSDPLSPPLAVSNFMGGRGPSVDAIVRVFLIGVLLLVVFAMAVHYGAAWEERKPHAGTGDIDRNYEQHIGETVFYWFTVVDTRGTRITIESDPLTLRLNRQLTVDVGDTIQVYGVLRPNREIDPIRIVNRRMTDERYMFAVSVFAALLTAGMALRDWRFTLDSLVFRRRDGR